MKKLNTLGVVVGATLLCAAPVSLHLSPATTLGLSLDAAQARVGRPLTPMSVAGVNRRMNRRAYAYGAYHGAYHQPYYNYNYHHPY
jgi:hypothetical protein